MTEMIWPAKITVHKHEQHYLGMENDEWFNERCSYCGSIYFEEFFNALKNKDCRVELADMKYGYAHKFYLDLPNNQMAKFYTRHLADINDKNTLDIILSLIKKRTKVNFVSHLNEICEK